MCSVDFITTTYNSITKTLMANLSYRPFGGAKGMNTGGGGTVGSTFNNAGRMTVSNPGATHEKTYAYDNNGNLTSINAPSLPYNSRVYGYDSLDRLTHAEGPWGDIDYTYDDVGNRQTETIGTNTQTYNYLTGTNRLNTITGGTAKTYTYDLNGNITGISNRALTYNQGNRLTKVEEGSNILGEYICNGLGQRIKKVAGTTTTIFHYDFDGNIIGESNLAGTFSKEYLYRSSNRLAMVDVASGSIYFFGNDSLGTPQILINSNNTVVWEANYKPFGEAAVNQGSTVVNNFRFKGQYLDSETGFHYNYHRYYEPTIGRYLTPDPIGQYGGINTYLYTGNNPTNLYDPLGLQSEYQHHWVPQSIWKNLDIPKEAKSVLKEAVIDAGKHGYFHPHPEYNRIVKELWDDSFKGIKPCEITEDMANNFVRQVKSDPRIRNMAVELLKRGGASVFPRWLKTTGKYAKKGIKYGGALVIVITEIIWTDETDAPTLYDEE